jgi:hypothetical protein
VGEIESIKRTYTKEDLGLLISMLGTIPEEKKNDTNRWTWWAGTEAMDRHTFPITRRSDYAKSDLQRIVEGKKDIRHLINKCFGRSISKWLRSFLLEPIEQAPLYINDPSLLKQTVARWRLTIAK